MTTANYAWSLPIVGGNQNQWGTMLNTILTDIDAKMVSKTDAQTLTNKTLTSPVISTISNTGTLTLPTTTDTLVGRATTDTLTNKTLAAPVITGGASISGNVSVAGTLSATDTLSLSGGGSNNQAAIRFLGAWANAATRDFCIDANSISYGHWLLRVSNAKGGDPYAAGTTILDATASGLAVTGIVTPEADNTRTLGTGALRWSTVYAGTGTINTSDAREKTKVRTLAEAEIEAAKDHSKEVGIYQFLESVKAKGDNARLHIGMTVQRSIEIMEKHGLDPMTYGFICYDAWADEFVEHPSIEAVEAKAAVLDDAGNEVEPAVESVEGKDAWTEQTQTAGDRYAFRYDQLNLFIARGLEARLAALESRA